MRTVYRYSVEPNSAHRGVYRIELDMLAGAKPLCVMKQARGVSIWAEVDDSIDKREAVVFYVVGTGFGRVPENGVYFGSVIDDPYVWHFYAEK